MKNRGFTLVETMITLAIMAIFVSLAVPVYKEYIWRARVMEAVSIINELNNKIKKCYLNDINVSSCEIGESFSVVGSNHISIFYKNTFDYKNFEVAVGLSESKVSYGINSRYSLVISSKIKKKNLEPELQYIVSYDDWSFIPRTITSRMLPEGWTKTPNCLVYNKKGDCFDL